MDDYSIYFFYPVLFCLIEGNYSLISGLSLLLFFGFIYNQKKRNTKYQIIIGILLSISTFKPQLSWLFLIWILLYAFKAKLFPLVLAFIGTILISSTLMLLFFPKWPIDFVKLLPTYQADGNLISVRTQLFLPYLSFQSAVIAGNIILVIIVIILIFLFYRFNFKANNTNLMQIAIIGLTTFIAHPSGFTYEQICLLIPILVIIDSKQHIGWQETITWIIFFLSFYLFLFLSWTFNDTGIIQKGPMVLMFAWLGWFTKSIWKKKITPQNSI